MALQSSRIRLADETRSNQKKEQQQNQGRWERRGRLGGAHHNPSNISNRLECQRSTFRFNVTKDSPETGTNFNKRNKSHNNHNNHNIKQNKTKIQQTGNFEPGLHGTTVDSFRN